MAADQNEPQPEERFVADLRNDRRICELVQSKEFAKELYAAITNQDWRNQDTEFDWGVTFREAAAIVAGLRGRSETYLDFYCSSPEGVVSPRVADELARLGWFPIPEPE